MLGPLTAAIAGALGIPAGNEEEDRVCCTLRMYTLDYIGRLLSQAVSKSIWKERIVKKEDMSINWGNVDQSCARYPQKVCNQ